MVLTSPSKAKGIENLSLDKVLRLGFVRLSQVRWLGLIILGIFSWRRMNALWLVSFLSLFTWSKKSWVQILSPAKNFTLKFILPTSHRIPTLPSYLCIFGCPQQTFIKNALTYNKRARMILTARLRQRVSRTYLWT